MIIFFLFCFSQTQLRPFYDRPLVGLRIFELARGITTMFCPFYAKVPSQPLWELPKEGVSQVDNWPGRCTQMRTLLCDASQTRPALLQPNPCIHDYFVVSCVHKPNAYMPPGKIQFLLGFFPIPFPVKREILKESLKSSYFRSSP